ncbi:hypothetical protein ACS0TY_021052 [Phlomoides rotata]
MDVCESEQALRKQSVAEKTRQPLVPAENKNGVLRQVQTRDVRSRYRSPTPSSPTDSKRCTSPFASRTSSTATLSAPKRAISAERKRPSSSSSPRTPSTPRSPSTPIQDTAAETLLASRKIVGNKLPESLWPSTMRSLSVSFQSESYSVPISKREKPVTPRVSSNVAHKQAEVLASRKRTPERKRSPLKGKNSVDQSENSKPVDSLNPRLVDQHRWPSRTAGKVPSALNRSVDLTDKTSKHSSLFHRPSLRRLSLDGIIKPLIKSASDLKMLVSRDDSRKATSKDCSEDYSSSQLEKLASQVSSSSSDRTQLSSSAARALSTPTPSLRPLSPSVSRGVSPSRAKSLNPFSRLPSPARIRPASPTRQSQSSNSVLSFIADIKPAKKAANQIEDVHQLRLLYNRHLQWRYANACNDSALHSQKLEAENMLYSVWMTTADLWDSIMKKRIDLLQLRLKLKLYSVLNNQLPCLDEWASMERDHVNSLTWAIQDLQARAIRIPITGRARGDIETVKAAICSAVDVMHAMGSSLCSILSRVEGMNSLVSQLANLAMQERAMFDEYESVLGSTTALQVEEHSLRTHLLQINAWRDGETSIFGY